MMTDVPRTTAKIYRFPQGGRAGHTSSRADLHQSPPPRIDFGGSWYHEAAIREAEQPRKQ